MIMNIKYRRFVAAIGLTLLVMMPAAICKADGTYHFLKGIPVNGAGECNFLSMDELGRRLYIVCPNQVKVLDLTKEQVVGTITNASGILGFAVAARAGRCFLTDGQESKMSMVSLQTYKTIMKIVTGQTPAAILFDPSRMEVYAFNQGDDSATVYEADDGDFLKTIKLTGKPGFAVADPKAGRVYCTLVDRLGMDVIDAKTLTITNHWSISPGEGVSGIADDPIGHRIYLGSTNKMILMFNGMTGMLLGAVPTDQAVVSIGFNPTRRLIVGCDGEGTVTVAMEYTLGNLKVLQTFKAGYKVRALAIDNKSDKIYLATDKTILVYGMGQ
jgi:DNA-binding beta-propeller fold protein YncE